MPCLCRSLILSLALILILPLPCSGNSFLETFREQTSILPNDEIRAVWVVRHALNSKEDIDRAIDYAIRARFHLIFAQVRGRADAYYASGIEPEARSLAQPAGQFSSADRRTSVHSTVTPSRASTSTSADPVGTRTGWTRPTGAPHT